MNLKDVVFATHSNCLDGSVCAILFLAVGGKKENLYFSSPAHDKTKDLMNDLLEKGSPIIFVDLSIPISQAEEIERRGSEVLVLDHHKSAIPISKFSWCHINEENTKCGSKMFFDWLLYNGYHQGEGQSVARYKDLVEVSDDRDRWINENPDTPVVVALHDVLGQNLFIERFVKNHNLQITAQEQYVINLENVQKEEYINRKMKHAVYYTRDVGDENVKFAVVTADRYQSEVGHALCSDPIDGADFAIMVYGNNISLRAREGCPIDLSKLAKAYGGGGHKTAAGCNLSSVLGADLLELVVDGLWGYFRAES